MTKTDEKALELLHENTMRILWELGMEFHSPEALEILGNAGVKVSGGRAFFSREQVEEALDKTPKSFVLKARNPKYDTLISPETQNVTAGYGSSYISAVDGRIRESGFDDFLLLASIVQESGVFTINGGILAQPCELAPAIAAPAMLYATMKRSDKAILGISSDKVLTERMLDMAGILFGKDDLRQNHRILTLISTMSPLSMDKNAADSLLANAMANQPLIIAPGPMAGGTGPITLAGNISMANAEILGANVLVQAVSPGLPIVYGFAATISDMRNMHVMNASAGFLKEAKYGALLAKRYGLPCRSGGGMSDAGGLTAQAGVESAMSLFLSYAYRANVIMHAAGSLHSFSSVNFEKFILDIETVERLRYFSSPLPVSEEDLAFAAIRDVVESGGQFMLHEHTLTHCRTAPWSPTVSLHGRAGSEPNGELYESINVRLEQLRDAYSRPAMDPDIERRLDEYMLNLGMSKEDIGRV